MQTGQLIGLPSREERTRGLAVPRKRGWAVVAALGWLLALLAEILLVLAIVYAQLLLAAFNRSAVASILLAVIICLTCVVPTGWMIVTMTRQAATRRPVLRVNREGIWIDRIPDPLLLGGDFIAWKQVWKISLSSSGKRLSVYLKSSSDHASHSSRWKRFVTRRDAAVNAPVSVTQAYAREPLERMVRRMETLYEQEIVLHHIVLSIPQKGREETAHTL